MSVATASAPLFMNAPIEPNTLSTGSLVSGISQDVLIGTNCWSFYCSPANLAAHSCDTRERSLRYSRRLFVYSPVFPVVLAPAFPVRLVMDVFRANFAYA